MSHSCDGAPFHPCLPLGHLIQVPLGTEKLITIQSVMIDHLWYKISTSDWLACILADISFRTQMTQMLCKQKVYSLQEGATVCTENPSFPTQYMPSKSKCGRTSSRLRYWISQHPYGATSVLRGNQRSLLFSLIWRKWLNSAATTKLIVRHLCFHFCMKSHAQLCHHINCTLLYITPAVYYFKTLQIAGIICHDHLSSCVPIVPLATIGPFPA